jgi:hypothetical protein
MRPGAHCGQPKLPRGQTAMSVVSIHTGPRSASLPERQNAGSEEPALTLELSESRTYDAALETLGAYKLTGNFTIDLEIVLKDMRVLDKVTYEIKPKTLLSDCRLVEFHPAQWVRPHSFFEIMRLVKNRIGSVAPRHWWVRLFQ